MGEENIELTVATVCRNVVKNGRSNSMRNCIESVHGQGYSLMEHLIVDGASTDGTMDLLKEYDEFHPRVISEPDHGIYDAMNKAIRMARGKYILFLNSDDAFADVGAVAAMMECIGRGDSDFLFANADVYSANHSKFLYTWKSSIDDIPFGYYPCHQTLLCRTEILKELKGFTECYMANDNLLMLKLVSRGYSHVYLDRVIVDFHVGGASGGMIADKERMRREHITFFMDEFGQKAGLRVKDCEWLYERSFLSLPPQDRFDLGARLVMPRWIRRYYEILADADRRASSRIQCQVRTKVLGRIPLFGVNVSI